MSSGALEGFRAAIRSAGLNPPDELEADGKLHRFPTNGKHSDDAGWYVLHIDGIPAGAFGNWRTGTSEAWRADIGRRLSPQEEAQHGARLTAMRREREAEEAKRKAEARERAAAVWQAARPAPGDHGYLQAKGVKAHGIREHNGALIVPMRDGTELHSLQFITADGSKRFLPGGRVSSCYFPIGKPNGVLCIAEGYATGASIHEATGYAVAVAFNAGNLMPVARTLRSKFPGLRLILCADDDADTPGNPGLMKAREAAEAAAGSLAVPDFGAERPEGATDFNDLHQLGGPEPVRACIEHAALVESSADPDASPQPKRTREPSPWPAALEIEAYHGLFGEIVNLIEPQTEADPMAILLQVIVFFGASVGRGPHVKVEGDQHHAAMYSVIVGETSKARKGTSAGRVKEIFSRSRYWPGTVEGLSSGEGLKFHVRDAREEEQYDKKTKLTESMLVDAGVTDKRLLVVESEFSQALRQTARSGNTLSATVRAAWDTGELRTLTKNDPITATGAHICIVGHITIHELRAELTATDTANGFANRFLFALAKRSKLLPFGGDPLGPDTLDNLARRLDTAIAHARSLNALTMTSAAKTIWGSVYAELSQSRPGLLGAVTARSEAHALRLALVYALADCSSEIDAPHLLAALAITEYTQASAAYIFGDSLGDPVADELLMALRRAGDEGLTRTSIRDLFKRHQRGDRINAALELLATRNLARRVDVRTDGRPSEVWRAATKATEATKGGST